MYILVGSSTTADRLRKVLERVLGYPAYVVHTPSAISRGGCSYCVQLSDRAIGEARQIAADNEIPIKNIYIVKTENGERVYNAVP